MDGQDRNVTISDIRIPFWRLVAFFIKASLAAIPAAIVLWLIGMAIATLFWLIVGGGEWTVMMQRWKM
jgi:hypothetical protein